MKMKPRMALAAISMSLLAATPALAQDYTLPATYGEITLNSGFSPDPYTVAVVAGGTTDASPLGPDCRGFVATAPDFQLTYNAGSFPLFFSVLSASDTTLVINGPDGGWYCNDDTNGLNPVVVFDGVAPSGTYDVWVGTFGTDTADATLYISELSAATDDGPVVSGPIISGPIGGGDAPDYTLPATFGEITLNAGFSPDPTTQDLVAGGTYDAYQLGSDCRGYVAQAPDFQLTYNAGTWPLIISVLSAADTTLVINGPDGGWYCNDDTDGLNPAVTFPTPQSGTYDIWVGTYGTDTAEAVLYISELAAGNGGGAATGPNPNLPATYGEVNVQAGFPGATTQVDAGGTIDASLTGGDSCYGYIAEAPDLAVNFANIAGLLPLVFAATSQGDTLLTILDPSGNWLCNDDTNGLNPEVRVQTPQAGRYLVWLGTFNSDGTTIPATVTVSTVGGLGGGLKP